MPRVSCRRTQASTGTPWLERGTYEYHHTYYSINLWTSEKVVSRKNPPLNLIGCIGGLKRIGRSWTRRLREGSLLERAIAQTPVNDGIQIF